MLETCLHLMVLNKNWLWILIWQQQFCEQQRWCYNQIWKLLNVFPFQIIQCNWSKKQLNVFVFNWTLFLATSQALAHPTSVLSDTLSTKLCIRIAFIIRTFKNSSHSNRHQLQILHIISSELYSFFVMMFSPAFSRLLFFYLNVLQAIASFCCQL